ncbi:N-acetyltransferase [Sphingobium sufflavum]|uniref:GNAT family N-acetyltransferase n=1 Tax=Sphingobium sufflavum TaxID=1129547 RepID=UPI001F34B4F6|nr:GNAT family N-acetyltransferase [Sphingobium sufflavum]MCE7796174.1 N-acetyltransferase [Sphingobium sufflavum]
MADTLTVHDNPDRSRYELAVGDALCLAAYDARGGALAFTHSEVPPSLEGKGYGSRLIAGALADVRARGLKVIPLCSFVAAYIDRHPEDQDLLATGAPG